jgi:hypothetical protein
MVEAGGFPSGRKAWTRHGSTRYLWKPDDLVKAIEYVSEGQGPDLPTLPGSLPYGRGSDPENPPTEPRQ